MSPRAVPVEPVEKGRVCSKCGTYKAWTEFYLRANGQCRSKCRACDKEYNDATSDRRRELKRQHRERNREEYDRRDREGWLRRKYHLSIAEYDRLLEAQGGGCALCGAPPGRIRLHVDHDPSCCPNHKHTCGKCIRGLLCFGCNQWLGGYEGNPERLARLSEYLSTDRQERAGGVPPWRVRPQ